MEQKLIKGLGNKLILAYNKEEKMYTVYDHGHIIGFKDYSNANKQFQSRLRFYKLGSGKPLSRIYDSKWCCDK